MNTLKWVLFCGLALGLVLLPAWAQTETGQITGTVTDPTRAAVAQAPVTVTSTGTGVSRSVRTSIDGTYSVTNLLPGQYIVAVSAEGFGKVSKKVTLTVGRRVGMDFQLEVGATSTVVEVVESATRVETESPTLSQTMAENQIRELPNLTRNPYQFVAIAGNVSDAGMGTRGAGFSINGQRESSTNILLDGASRDFSHGV
jgi:hypothetical protein